MIRITGTGLFHPLHTISNEELVNSYNTYVDKVCTELGPDSGEVLPEPSSKEFIEKASGIYSRYVLDKDGVLDPARMRPKLALREKTEISYQAEMCLVAAEEALTRAACDANEIDCVIVACSNFERPYPSIAIEVQSLLGTGGFAFDMNVACSSATFALQQAYATLMSQQASKVLVINPEICSAHLDYKSRDCHFIFGDATTAMVVERDSNKPGLQIKHIQSKTQYSTNIYNPGGFLANCMEPKHPTNLFSQEGRKVFKEVIPMAVKVISSQLAENDLQESEVKQFWLHQANRHMNELIVAKITGQEFDESRSPIILDEFANTSSAGSVITMHRNQDKLADQEYAILCSFGAGYSIGSVLLQKQGV